jgi:DNA-binding MarR family transcriptional regulator
MGKKSKEKGRKRDRRHDVTGAEALGRTESAGSAPRVDPGAWSAPTAESPSRATVAIDPEPSAVRAYDVEATELAARLASLSTVLQRHLARAEAGDGLTRARLSALALLVLGGPRTLGQLAGAEGVRPPTMTRLVHAMEADGLVVRESNPVDGRSVIIRSTASAEALLAAGRARQLAPLAAALGALDTSERRALQDAAESLGRVLRDASWDAIDPTA